MNCVKFCGIVILVILRLQIATDISVQTMSKLPFLPCYTFIDIALRPIFSCSSYINRPIRLNEERNADCRFWFGCKEASTPGSNAFKVNRYYRGTDLLLSIDSLNMGVVYKNLVRQTVGGKLQRGFEERPKESVKRDEKKKQLEKQIAALESKIR